MKFSGYFRDIVTWFCELIHITKKECRPSSERHASTTSGAKYRPMGEGHVHIHRGVRWGPG